MEKLYTVNEVCEYFGVTRDTVYAWMRAGRLPYVQFGGRRRVTESAVQGFIKPVIVEPPEASRPKLDPSWAS